VVAIVGEHPGHAELLRDQTGPHRPPLKAAFPAKAGIHPSAGSTSPSSRE
jgi:hypothetical protein